MPCVSEPGYFGTNGMSESRHDSPFANSGLVVTDRARTTWRAATRWPASTSSRRPSGWPTSPGGRTYTAPIQWARDFLAGRPSRGKLPQQLRAGDGRRPTSA